MSEILFRGKDDESGKFVYGYYGLERDMRKKIPFILKPSISWEEDDILFSSFVIPKTVGQFTGLTDKNGTKIFEGDVLKIKNEDYDYEYTTKVYYSNHTLCVDVEGQDYDYTAIGFADYIWDTECCEIEVIGNIHDNPDLLKGA